MNNHNFSHQNVRTKTSLFKNTLSFLEFLDSTEGMVCILHIILALSAGTYPTVHAIIQPGKVIEEISKQLHLSDGKKVGDCDAILVSSPGEIDSQHCYSKNQNILSIAHCSLKGCASSTCLLPLANDSPNFL